MDHRPTLSDVHVSDVEDSHPNTVSPLRKQSAKPEPLLSSDQLLQMLSSMWKQMENQQMEMIRLCEVAAVKRRQQPVSRHGFSNRSKHNRGSRSSPTTERNPRAPFTNMHTRIRSLHRKFKAPLIGDLRRCRGIQGHSTFLNPEVLYIEDIAYLVHERLNQVSQQFLKGWTTAG